eukprot:SAG11_NODE_1541_length_4721_cov_6.831458_2_plen_150_part_00
MAQAAVDGETEEKTMDEVATHNSEDSCWLVVEERVLDVTPFFARHPGGERALRRYAGTDATSVFTELHTRAILAEWAPKLQIGVLAAAPPPPPLPFLPELRTPGCDLSKCSEAPTCIHVAFCGCAFAHERQPDAALSCLTAFTICCACV